MSLTPKLGLGLALSLIAGLSAPLMAPVVLSNAATSNRFASFLVQTQTVQAQTVQAQATQAQTTAFSDVPADYWASDYIQGLAKSNVISGFGDGTFRPNDPVTRAQFAAILRQAFLKSQPTTAQAFKDVPAGYWARDAIASARSAGFLFGYPDNAFKPNDRILRVQALISLANGLKYPAGNSQDLSSYKDADAVPAYARPSTAAAAQANLVVSYPAPDQISPNRAASRAEVAAFVYQALVKAGRASPIAAKPERRWQVTPTQTIAAAVYQMSLSEDGQQLAAITTNGERLNVWNTQTGALLLTATANEPGHLFSTTAISKDGTQVAALEGASIDKQLVVRAVEDGRILLDKPLNSPQVLLSEAGYITDSSALNVVFSPDGKALITQSAFITRPLGDFSRNRLTYNSLSFHDINTDKVSQSIDLMGVDDKDPIGTVVSPDGNLLASLSANNSIPTIWGGGVISRITLWQRNQNNRFEYLKTLPISKDSSDVFNVAFTSNNQLNLVTCNSSDFFANKPFTYLETWNPLTAEQVQSNVIPDGECIQQGNIPSPDGTSYFSSYPNLGVYFRNIQTGEFQRNLDKLLADVEKGVFSGNGDAIAVADDREIRIFTKAAP